MKSSSHISDVIILGAGAAGLFCAFTAAQRGRKVVVLERNASVGEKIRISGGGRCNFTNRTSGPGNFLSANPEFCTSALSRFTPNDFIALVERHHIPYFEKKDGQLFGEESSERIIRMLLDECERGGVEVKTGTRCGDVVKGTEFRVNTSEGTLISNTLVVATGGLSIPKLGASDFGYRLAKQFGIGIVPPRPGLVPLTLPADTEASVLSGVSLKVRIRLAEAEFEEMMLFTHRGLSGPVILQASSYWKPGVSLEIDLLPNRAVADIVTGGGRRTVLNAFDLVWPRRFAEWWLDKKLARTVCSELSKKEVGALDERVHRWQVTPSGTEGFAKAEVTMGGVDTRELSSKTMEARRVPGMHFIGEVVDVTGWLGGHNFQWAWASGAAAGENI